MMNNNGDYNNERVCGNCIWNDAGLCDKSGYFVDDDNECFCKDGFEKKVNNNSGRLLSMWM